ncbi:MAG: hypothetical protein AB8G99_26725 [Planctomycetaceae bacterium]
MHRAFNVLGRCLYTIVIAPFVIVVAIPALALALMFFASLLPRWLWSNHKWKRALARNGRFRNPKVIVAKLDTGTLIVDSPTLGWGLKQCWWTPDEIRTITPHPVPTEATREAHYETEPETPGLPFDRWVHSHYLDTDGGSAILLSFRRGDRFAAKCKRRNPALDIVSTWSGPVREPSASSR